MLTVLAAASVASTGASAGAAKEASSVRWSSKSPSCFDSTEGCEHGEEAELMKVTLLQTSLAVGAAKRSAAVTLAAESAAAVPATKAREAHDLDNSEHESLAEMALTAFLQTEVALEGAAAAALPYSAKAATEQAIQDCAELEHLRSTTTTLQLQVQVETLAALGRFPSSCEGTSLHQAGRAASSSFSLLQESAVERTVPVVDAIRMREYSVLLVYLLFYIASMAILNYYMVNPAQKFQKPLDFPDKEKPKAADIDIEEETWNRSYLSWLAVSWASPWIARWGSSQDAAFTKVRPSEMPQLGRKADQATPAAEVFEKLWQEEIDRVGEAKANVLSVILRVYTWKTMLYLMFVMGVMTVIGQVYSVFLIQHALKYFYWLQGYAEATGGERPEMTVPMLVAITVFSVLPMSTVGLSSSVSSYSIVLDQKLCGGIALALFRKAQRLPSSKLQAVNPDTPMNSERHGEADLMQLVNYDVNTNLLGAWYNLCLCANSIVVILVLTVLLWMRLGVATLCAASCAVPVVFLSMSMSGGLGFSMYLLQDSMDRRIATLREVLFGIRIIKCYAWEEAMEKRIGLLRREEVKGLVSYFDFLGWFMGIFLTFPRLLIITGLWGYSAIYGHHDVATIFTCMQILSSLKSSCDSFTRSFSRVLTIIPSIRRIEVFLKTPEAPFLPPHRIPNWIELWRPQAAGNQEADAPAEGASPSLRLRGNFAWGEYCVPVLRNMNLEIGRGELVGIVGKVGSGKSTLLQALLGELYPVEGLEEPLLSRPELIAYCSQVAHIAEGTLKENVLFGQAFEEERYKQVLEAAALDGDLKVLPGGDSVPIGTRGITLSGGQKARVALARAAYHKASNLLLFDDPFGAVDAPTAMVILEKLLLGPLLKGKTRLVVLQPDAERLERFDKVVVLEDGCVLECGEPSKVMETDAFKRLLANTSEEFLGRRSPVSGEESTRISPKPKSQENNKALQLKLREEEFEGRPTLEMVRSYCRLGRWRNIWNTSILFCVQIFIYLLCDLVLAHWTNDMAFNPDLDDGPYLRGYFFWLLLGTAYWVICWKYGQWFTLRISSYIHSMVLEKVLRAPVDKFFDKHPVGRIMNRLGADLAVVDLYLFQKSTGTIAIIYQTLIPLIYVHTMLPWFVTVMAIPFYYLIWSSCVRYWNTTVPFRYCMTTCRSEINGLVSDVASNNVVIRAYQDQDRIASDMAVALDNQLKAMLLGERVLRRWLVNRLYFMWSFYTVTTYLVGLMNTTAIGAGTLGLCLTNLLLLESLIEPNLDAATGAQFEFIALARIQEYLNIPQEKARREESDKKYRNIMIRVTRRDLGKLELVEKDRVEVHKDGKVILKATEDNTGLRAVAPATLLDLCPKATELANAADWHRIVTVEDAIKDSRAMAEELCGVRKAPRAPSPLQLVTLDIQSGWLEHGARVQIQDVKAAYADIPRYVLKGLTTTFEPKTKVAIVGTTGCGKSSLLLVLLRILEPASGRVLINDVDTSKLGLATLRSALGLVPQDPVLFSGSLRHNLDPFGHYSDGRLWRALECARLKELVESWILRLDHQISDEGSNISFGQRQLVCLARMILRQPALLLLDEATSAIDPHTQEAVQTTINSAFPGSTLVAVAHRLETILDFDQVVVMQRGEVVEEGPVKEVARREDGVLHQMLSAKRTW